MHLDPHENKRFFEINKGADEKHKNIKRETDIWKYFNKRKILKVSDLDCREFILSVVSDPRLASQSNQTNLELGIISMVQEGIFLADCTNINGGACHMRTKCTFFSNAAEPTL